MESTKIKKQTKKNKLIDTENRLVVTRWEELRGLKWVKGVKGVKSKNFQS